MDIKHLIGQIVVVQSKGVMVTGPLKCVGGQYQVHRTLAQERFAIAECFFCFWEPNVMEVQGNIIEIG